MSKEEDKNFISYDELINAIENDHSSNKIKEISSHFINSINDWPTLNLREPKVFISELKNSVNAHLTFFNIQKYLKSLRVDSEAWKMESLASILKMFDDGEVNGISIEEVSIETIVMQMTQHYRKTKKEK